MGKFGERQAKLTEKKAKFCVKVVELLEQSAAYRAVYDTSRMKASTVHRKASQLMKNPLVSARVAELRAKAAERAEVNTADVIREAARIAFADVRKLFDERGRLRPVHKLPDDVAAAIASIEHGMLGVVKVKCWDKNPALEKLMKHLGLFKEDNRQKIDAIADLMAAIDGKSIRLTVKS
ncbi:MAG: terminase small subunit [Pyrinomonadaceae bacterium]